MTEPVAWSRRRFLAATGLLGTAAAAAQLPGFAGLWPARAQSADDLLGPLLGTGGDLLQTLATDTISGVVAFVVPGDDAYSRAQGVTAPDLGGVVAEGPQFLMHALDHFLPVPDTYLAPLVRGLAAGASAVPIPLPPELLAVPDELATTLDEALLVLLANDQSVPLSAVIALVVNLAATSAHPESVAGPFLSPFANLDFAGKMDAWRFLEEDAAAITETIDGSLPEPLSRSLSGLVRFVGGALVEFAAFGAYSEWGVFDREAQIATERPVGWEMSSYLPGRHTPMHGWDELRGYYGEVRAVEGSWDLDPASSEG